MYEVHAERCAILYDLIKMEMNACFQLEYRHSPSGETGSIQCTKCMVEQLFDSKNISSNGVCIVYTVLRTYLYSSH